MRGPLHLILAALWALALLTGCGDWAGEITASPIPETPSPVLTESPRPDVTEPVETENKEETAMKMKVQIGDYTFTATLEDNQAVAELVEMMEAGPVTLELDDYSGFEKVGPLGRSLTTSNSQTTTVAGDIVLYNGNNIVMFYGSNSWSYTRLGKIDDLTGWTEALGRGSVTVTFSLEE